MTDGFNLRVGEEELLTGDIATSTLRAADEFCEFVCHVVGCDQITIRQREPGGDHRYGMCESRQSMLTKKAKQLTRALTWHGLMGVRLCWHGPHVVRRAWLNAWIARHGVRGLSKHRTSSLFTMECTSAPTKK